VPSNKTNCEAFDVTTSTMPVLLS